MPKNRCRRDQPVAVEAADPVVVAVLHVRRDPLDLVAALEHLVAQAGVAAAVADVPLPGRDDLERLVALLVEVRHPLASASARRRGRRTRAAAPTIASRALNVVLPASARRTPPRRSPPSHSGVSRVQPAVAADHGAHRQLQLAPPRARRSGRRTCSTSRCRRPCPSRPRVRQRPGSRRRRPGEVTVVPNSGW